MKDFLFKHYLANPTTSFMNSLKELLTLASDKEVILHTEGNSQALFNILLSVKKPFITIMPLENQSFLTKLGLIK